MENKPQFIVNCERIDKRSHFKLVFNYNIDLINKIKDLPKPDRIWDGDEKAWHLTTRSLFKLISLFGRNDGYFFKFNEEDRAYFITQIAKLQEKEEEEKEELKQVEKSNKANLKLKEYLEINFKSLENKLLEVVKDGIKFYPHQVVAVLFLEKVKNALIALDMGTGKTLISITHSELQKFNKILVVVPNSLKFNFFDEVEKYTFSKANIIGWKKNFFSTTESKYVIVNYDFFRNKDHDKVKEKLEEYSINLKSFDAVIFDECQKLKNTKSNTYKNITKILKVIKPKSKVFLSGTPAPNRAYELYSVLHEIAPIEFATKKDFYEFCGMHYDIHTGLWETDINKTKFEELFHKISPHVYRKKKEEILKDLPDKVYQKISIEMDDAQLKGYQALEEDVVMEFMGQTLTFEQNPLTKLISLRQYTSKIKIESVSDIVESLLENGEKVIIVDVFKEPLYQYFERFKNIAVMHTGDQDLDQRNEAKTMFQDPDSHVKLFLGSIQTCNYGLTLTAASKMIINTSPYSVGEYDQVADRIHRIGQKNTAWIYPAIVRDTIDEMVFDILEEKRTEIVKVIDNQVYESKVGESIAKELLAKLKEKVLKKKDG